MTFSVTPAGGFVPPEATDVPSFLQFQDQGVDLGGPDADTLNAGSGLSATRGTGENENVITLTGGGPFAINTQAGTVYTVVQNDGVNTVVETTNAAAVTVTLPLDNPTGVDFDTGTTILLLQRGAGQATIVGASGVTVHNSSSPSTRVQFSMVAVLKIGPNEWVVVGDFA